MEAQAEKVYGIDWKVLQEEHMEWATRNFPNRKKYHPLLGVIEETGELAHAQLKLEQGIRGTAAEHEAKRKDAIGDIVVFLQDYCNLNSVNINVAARNSLWKSGHREATIFRATVFSLSYLVGELATVGNSSGAVGKILGCLNEYCENTGLDFADCVNETWGRVKQRDWIKNAQDGGEKEVQ